MGFHCECVACSKSSQVRAEMEKMLHLASTYKCQACEGPMLEIGHSCTYCNADIDINLIRAKMRKVTGVMKSAAMHAGKPLPYFKEALDIGKEIFFEMHDMLIDIRDKLAHSSARNDDFETAAELVFENYKTMPKVRKRQHRSSKRIDQVGESVDTYSWQREQRADCMSSRPDGTEYIRVRLQGRTQLTRCLICLLEKLCSTVHEMSSHLILIVFEFRYFDKEASRIHAARHWPYLFRHKM